MSTPLSKASNTKQDAAGGAAKAEACPRADIASSGEAAEASTVPDQPQILGVVHAGGLLQDATLARQTPAIARAVFAPKHCGAANVMRVRAFAEAQQVLLSRELAQQIACTTLVCELQALVIGPLEHCMLFSSVAALTGPPGSASYAAANAALDGRAATLLAQGVLLFTG